MANPYTPVDPVSRLRISAWHLLMGRMTSELALTRGLYTYKQYHRKYEFTVTRLPHNYFCTAEIYLKTVLIWKVNKSRFSAHSLISSLLQYRWQKQWCPPARTDPLIGYRKRRPAYSSVGFLWLVDTFRSIQDTGEPLSALPETHSSWTLL